MPSAGGGGGGGGGQEREELEAQVEEKKRINRTKSMDTGKLKIREYHWIAGQRKT